MTARPDPVGPVRASPVTAALLGLAALAAVVAACGTATTGPSATASSATASSGAGPSGAASTGADQAAPRATAWPGGVVEAVVILGKADAEIQAAGADLGAAVAYEDLRAMWGAADGLATLVERLQTQVPRIRDYPLTAPVAKAYDAAFPDMLAGATKLRDAITAGDAAGIAAGSQQLSAGLDRYREARSEIGPLIEQALLMQRILYK